MLALAGCTGGISPDDTPPEEIPANATSVACSELSSTEQQAFDGVHREGSVTVYEADVWGTPDRSYSAEILSSTWPGERATPGGGVGDSKGRYLKKNGTYYQVRFSRAGYQADGPQIERIENPANQSVINVSDKSGRGFEFLRHTINVTDGDGFRHGLVDVPVGGGDILAYRGQYYRVEYVRVSHYEAYRITIAEVG